MLIVDPWFYVTAIPAVFIYGMAKGGLGGAAGAMSVPLMSLTADPLQAAAILLPIICLMDLQVLHLFWRKFDAHSLRILVPASVIGIAVGSLLLGVLPGFALKIMLGSIAILFCLDRWTQRRSEQSNSPPGDWSGRFWGFVAGITSTHIHAGAPPASIYLLPKNLDKVILVGTFGVFFAVLNFVKLIPYTLLQQFDSQNLITALVLSPLGPLGVWAGYKVLHYFDQQAIYRIIYVFLLLTGGKLLVDGLGAML